MVKRRKQLSLGWRIGIAIVSIPVFVLVFELIFALIPVSTFYENRFFILNRALDYPEVFRRDHDLFWRLRPDQIIRSKFFEGKEYHINSLGLRGPEVPKEKGSFRIAALGNSCTFGWGVSYDSTYLAQLKSLIESNPDFGEVEIVNCGIPGYSSFQGRRFLVSDVAALKPDMILIMFGWNDQWAAAGNIPDKDQQFPEQWVLDIGNCFSRFKIYGLMRRMILSSTEESLEDRLDKEHPVYRVSVDDFYDNIEVIIRYCFNEGIIPVVLTSPIPSLEKYYPEGSRSNMHRYHYQYNYQARTAADNNRAILIDLAGEFDNYDDLFDDAARDPIHFNAGGHKVAAEAIYRYIEDNPYLLIIDE